MTGSSKPTPTGHVVSRERWEPQRLREGLTAQKENRPAGEGGGHVTRDLCPIHGNGGALLAWLRAAPAGKNGDFGEGEKEEPGLQ